MTDFHCFEHQIEIHKRGIPHVNKFQQGPLHEFVISFTISDKVPLGISSNQNINFKDVVFSNGMNQIQFLKMRKLN